MNRAVLRSQEGAGELRLKQRGRLQKYWCPAYFIQPFKDWEDFTYKQTAWERLSVFENSKTETNCYRYSIHTEPMYTFVLSKFSEKDQIGLSKLKFTNE